MKSLKLKCSLDGSCEGLKEVGGKKTCSCLLCIRLQIYFFFQKKTSDQKEYRSEKRRRRRGDEVAVHTASIWPWFLVCK